MKTLTSDVSTQVHASQSQPVTLVEITLNAGTLRYCTGKSNLIFPTGGNTYTARAIIVDEIAQTTEGQIERISLRIDNITGEFTSYAAAESFDGKSIVIKRVYLDALSSSSDYVERFNGTLEEIQKLSVRWCQLSAIIGKSLNYELLSDIYQPKCNRLFGDTRCNQDGYANLSSLVLTANVTSGTGTTFAVSSGQVDDYWNFGPVKIEISGTTYYRRIKDYANSGDIFTVDVGLPVIVAAGSTIQVYKGCDHKLDTCKSNNAWGPSSDNHANFFGFIHITKQSGDIGTAGPRERKQSSAGNTLPGEYMGGVGMDVVGDIGEFEGGAGGWGAPGDAEGGFPA